MPDHAKPRRARSSAEANNTILEVGAGNGRLSYFLARELATSYPCRCDLLPRPLSASMALHPAGPSSPSSRTRRGDEAEDSDGAFRQRRVFTIVSTDSGARGLGVEAQQQFPVEELGHEEALVKYSPQMVLVCWMELGVDWTAAFRWLGDALVLRPVAVWRVPLSPAAAAASPCKAARG